MKSPAAAIYTNSERSGLDDGEMEQVDGVLSPPIGDSLLLKFRQVGTSPVGLIVVVAS